MASDGFARHVTRSFPTRAEELLRGGSIYWVIQGEILCRQRILRLDTVSGDDGIRRCAIVLDPLLIRTTPTLKRPFQGWRYLAATDAPRDLPPSRDGEDTLPTALQSALTQIGVI